MYYVSVAYSGSKEGILEGWVDYGRVAYLRRGGIFSEGGVDSGRAEKILVAPHGSIVVEKGVYSGRNGWIMGMSHIVTKKGGIYSGKKG